MLPRPLSFDITPFSPKNGKPALSPRHDWLNTGSLLQNVPLRIWFYPQ
ncbi:TPA: transcriptional regulator [Escherichia coli]|nr:transcriptional regulator [Escherichia coli]HEI3649881.1 transcriptional regulator [Escherichia coli]